MKVSHWDGGGGSRGIPPRTWRREGHSSPPPPVPCSAVYDRQVMYTGWMVKHILAKVRVFIRYKKQTFPFPEDWLILGVTGIARSAGIVWMSTVEAPPGVALWVIQTGQDKDAMIIQTQTHTGCVFMASIVKYPPIYWNHISDSCRMTPTAFQVLLLRYRQVFSRHLFIWDVPWNSLTEKRLDSPLGRIIHLMRIMVYIVRK